MTNAELSDLLLDSLALWGVIGRTSVGKNEVRLVTEAGQDIAIRRQVTARKGWSLEILKWPVEIPAPARPIRTCASVVSLLRATRALVDAKRTEARLRFTPAAPPAGDSR
jgi:hypothetical protein